MKCKIQGFSLNELLKIYGIGNGGFYSDWWKNEKFAYEKPEAGEYDIDFTKKLTNLTYDEQVKQLSEGHIMVHSAVLAEAVLSHYKETRKRLLEDWYSRTISVDSDGCHVGVGYFVAGRLHVDYFYWGDYRYDSIGVASVKSIEPCKLDPYDHSQNHTRRLP